MNIKLPITANASLNSYSIHNLRKVWGNYPNVINWPYQLSYVLPMK